MKIALSQLNYHIGNFEDNTSKIIDSIKKAKKENVGLVIFSELAVSGYPPLDFLEFEHFVKKCNASIELIARECIGIAAIVGSPSDNPVLKGKNHFNSAFFLQDGKIKNVIHKTLLPTYDVFDEYRYFEPNKKFECIELNGTTIALTICEDLWNEEEDPLYTFCPMDELIKHAPEFIINIAASPFDYQHAEFRKAILKRNALKYNLPILYVNHVGAQTEMLFDGGSLVMNKKGDIIEELKFFEEDFLIFDAQFTNNDLDKFQPKITISKSKIEKIYSALVMGTRDYFRKMNFKQATLGLSGGLDSAVVLVLTAEALGRENVFPVLLPSEFSSEHSITDSIKLAENLGVKHDTISIRKIYDEFISSTQPFFKDLPFNVAEENMQARIRGALLMALANKFGYILLNTSNKSELAVGYGTLYGDMCGGLSVIGDVYKTDVFELAHFINQNKEIIPENIIAKPPSAELHHGQKDTDSLPPYDLLDKILFQYIEKHLGPHEIIN
ncbi:MAG TPA: NAD+ synthase, partial [Bacteroidia bacterium]|nr:NAD+ synthase [Bacteroidia bacterium]